MAHKIENRAHIAKEMKMIREIFAETLAEWQLQKQPTNLKLNAPRAYNWNADELKLPEFTVIFYFLAS